MTRLLCRVFLVVTPLSLAVVLWWHPPGGDEIYEDVRDDVDAWMFVHTVFLFFVPLMAAGAIDAGRQMIELRPILARTGWWREERQA